MEVTTLEVPQAEAVEQLAQLKAMFKADASLKKNKVYRDLKRAYGHMKHGGKIIDIYEAFKASGVDEDGNPKIAIIRADAKIAYLYKARKGRAIFTTKIDRWGRASSEARKSERDIEVPEGTFPWDYFNGNDRTKKTIVPIIPPQLINENVKYHLRNYAILWEVEDWENTPPIDPILMKGITPNLFAVLATWDLTELERAIIKSHINL